MSEILQTFTHIYKPDDIYKIEEYQDKVKWERFGAIED